MGPRRLTVATVVVALLLMTLASPLSAGGSWFDPVKDRYEPGEEATLVGYTGGGAYGWIEDGPFFGYLVESTEDGGPAVEGMRLPVGEIQLEDTGSGGYLRLRASITFLLPADLEPAIYAFDYCNADCSERLGDLIGGVVYVGVDPDYRPSREWALDDPEIANLEPDAQLSGPGFETTADELTSPPTSASVSVSLPLIEDSQESVSLPLIEDSQESTPVIAVAVPEVDEPSAASWPLWGLFLAAGLGGAVFARRRSKFSD